MTRTLVLLVTSAFTVYAFGALERQAVPRNDTKKFRTEGLFEGGSEVKANLEDLRIADHNGYERWVVDFSDVAKRSLDKVAPKFQLRYVPGETVNGADGAMVMRQSAKFILSFRAIQRNFIARDKLAALVKKSRWVQQIIVYPPIEKGDTAIEFVLKENVAFSPYQPMEREGRLVIDLKAP